MHDDLRVGFDDDQQPGRSADEIRVAIASVLYDALAANDDGERLLSRHSADPLTDAVVAEVVSPLIAERDEAREAFDTVKEESAELQRKYSQPGEPRTIRCGSCNQHEAVDKAKAEARALAKTARRYRRERDEQRQRAEIAEMRLDACRKVFIDDAYFTEAEVGPDIAPRIVERLSELRSQVDDRDATIADLRFETGTLRRILEDYPEVHAVFGVGDDQVHADWCYACERDRLREAVARVRALHVPFNLWDQSGEEIVKLTFCAGCLRADLMENFKATGFLAIDDCTPYSECLTLAALDGTGEDAR